MNVLDIIRNNLKASGADGLVNNSESCGCGIDDLAPCEGIQRGCCAARSRIATSPGEFQEVGDKVFYPIELAPPQSLRQRFIAEQAALAEALRINGMTIHQLLKELEK